MRHCKRMIFMLVAMLICESVGAGIKKSDLSVLYVGGSADINSYNADSAVLAESAARRMASFEKLLKQYFKKVTVIDAKEYTVALSDNYDVTVMDGRPQEIVPQIWERDEDGNTTKYQRPGYLPQDFSRPMLMIGEMSSVLGNRIGLKTDWYCLCLEADAHHIRTEHPIFNGPFPVKMTMVTKSTPEAGKAFPYFAGGPAPDSLSMWRVQKTGYMTDPTARVGMVSRPGGFEDSPEAEIISGGVSAKSLDAMAIGRHGNFLHWGFAASPDNMTEEAKNVFANAIVYISQFAGQTPIARKYDETIITRDYAKYFAYFAKRVYYNQTVENEMRYARTMKEEQEKAQEKQAKGEKLDDAEKFALNFKEQEPKTYEQFLQELFPNLYLFYGTDETEYADYFTNNAPYFRPDPKNYGFIIDEDARSLGIPNNDIRLLDKAISLWEAGGPDAVKGRRLLERYTLCRFDTPAEWRAWYEANKSRLFFTEAGGWYFLVNTRDKSVPGNDYSVLEAPEKESSALTVNTSGKSVQLKTDDQNPVRMAVFSETLPNGNRQIILRVKIHPGYHIYARVADSDPFVATTVEFRLPEGVEEVGEMQRPSGKVYNSAGTVVYEGEIEFRQEVSGQETVTCAINYQCCNDQICMPPAELVLTAD